MSYQNLAQVRQKIKDYRTNVTKLNNLRNKIKERVSDIHKSIANLQEQERQLAFDLIIANVEKNDELKISAELWSIAGLMGGDTVKVVRKNKKSITVEIVDVDLTKYNNDYYRNSQAKRLGKKARIENKYLQTLLFSDLETMIKRNEMLSDLLS
jgi:endonuclease YncB( thermonuclease family)